MFGPLTNEQVRINPARARRIKQAEVGEGELSQLISRPYPKGVYTSDTGPMERLEDVWVIDTLPEELARKFHKYKNSCLK